MNRYQEFIIDYEFRIKWSVYVCVREREGGAERKYNKHLLQLKLSNQKKIAILLKSKIEIHTSFTYFYFNFNIFTYMSRLPMHGWLVDWLDWVFLCDIRLFSDDSVFFLFVFFLFLFLTTIINYFRSNPFWENGTQPFENREKNK